MFAAVVLPLQIRQATAKIIKVRAGNPTSQVNHGSSADRGRAFGSGGGGAYDAGYSGTSMTGGKGAAGVCIIEEFA
ncbi:hypothetical protein APECO78_14705 [Escherichia coli APEC O78]|nr:hypothetical protein APECO78_14705 [Escherichia coli APEC O78]POS41572.1 hypothetical protein BJP18_24425 [Escherichia coli]